MLYGIIADVHGNLEALEAALEQLRDVDKIICAGDMIGYGPNPNECVEKIKELNIPSVIGNHESALIGRLALTWFNDNAQNALAWTKKEIAPQHLAYFEALPEVLEEDDFQYVHGSLRSPAEEYISSIFDAIPAFERMSRPVCFAGHYHKPLFIARKFDGNYDGRMLADEDEIIIEDYEKVIINPGAIGQPRDGDPRASFGIYNSKTKIFSLHRVEYDILKVQEKMAEAKLPYPLMARLEFGR